MGALAKALCWDYTPLDVEEVVVEVSRLSLLVGIGTALEMGYDYGRVASDMGMGKDPDRMRGTGTMERVKERASAAERTVQAR